MTSTSLRRAGRRLGVVMLVLVLAAGSAWAQGGKAPDHSAHDRTKVPKAQRAEDMVKHGEELRKKIDDFGASTTPCPRTPQEWEDAIDLVAQWKAYQDLRDSMKAEFPKELEGTPLGTRYDEVFKDKKKATRAAEARLRNCGPPPQNILGDNIDIIQVVQQRLQRWIDIEKGLAGIIALAVIDCPDCKRERQRVNTGGSGSTGGPR